MSNSLQERGKNKRGSKTDKQKTKKSNGRLKTQYMSLYESSIVCIQQLKQTDWQSGFQNVYHPCAIYKKLTSNMVIYVG